MMVFRKSRLKSFELYRGNVSEALTEERPWLWERRLDGDLELDKEDDDAEGGSGLWGSAKDRSALLPDEDEYIALGLGRLLEDSSLDNLKASSGVGRPEASLGIPCPNSGD